jgi:hypothetical protein
METVPKMTMMNYDSPWTRLVHCGIWSSDAYVGSCHIGKFYENHVWFILTHYGEHVEFSWMFYRIYELREILDDAIYDTRRQPQNHYHMPKNR